MLFLTHTDVGGLYDRDTKHLVPDLLTISAELQTIVRTNKEFISEYYRRLVREFDFPLCNEEWATHSASLNLGLEPNQAIEDILAVAQNANTTESFFVLCYYFCRLNCTFVFAGVSPFLRVSEPLVVALCVCFLYLFFCFSSFPYLCR